MAEIGNFIYKVDWLIGDEVTNTSMIDPSEKGQAEWLNAFIVTTKESPHPLARLRITTLQVADINEVVPDNPQTLEELGI